MGPLPGFLPSWSSSGSASAEICQCLERFTLAHARDRESGTLKFIIADLGFRHIGKVYLLDDAGKGDVFLARQGVITFDAQNLPRYRKVSQPSSEGVGAKRI